MRNYKTTNLDEFLMPKDAPITTIGGVSSYDFDSLNERAVITAAKLAANAVGTFALGTAQIITAQIADLAVTNGKLANDSVSAAKIAGSAIGESEINDSVVTAAKIATAVGKALIGNSASGSIGFYGATPIGQPGTIADATDSTTVVTQFNLLLGTLRLLGLIDS